MESPICYAYMHPTVGDPSTVSQMREAVTQALRLNVLKS